MEITTDDHVKVSGMMHLLLPVEVKCKNRLREKLIRIFGCLPISGHETTVPQLKDVYQNFTSIHRAAVALLDDLRTKFPENKEYVDLRMEAGLLITFCRCMLYRIFDEDRTTINRSVVDLLAEIEFHLLDLVKDYTDKNYFERVPFSQMTDMMGDIDEAFSDPSPIYCYQLIINYDLMMEFLDQCLDDLDCFDGDKDTRASLKEDFFVLRNYLELLTKDQFHGGSLENSLIVVENVAYDMARYFFFAGMRGREFRKYRNSKSYYDVQSKFRVRVLRALILLSEGSSGAQLMSDELVKGYVKCVQDNLLELRKRNSLKSQLKILHEGNSLLMHLLIMYPPKHNFNLEKLSNIRLDFQALARNVGSFVCSCFDSPEIAEISLELFDFIEKADVITGQTIRTICCIVLERMGQESPKTDQMGLLILLLGKLKEFMDQRPDLIMNWKVHENLFIFTFYLIQNNIRGDNVADDDFFRNTLDQLDVSLVNNEELNGVLISTQVLAFKMACHSLLRSYIKLPWWELYLGTKDSVDLHMRIGILNALVSSLDDASSKSMDFELLIAYVDCIQDNLIELFRDEDFAPLKGQFDILYEGILFHLRLLLSHKEEQGKLSHIKVRFQELVRSVGSAVCSCFSNCLWGEMKTCQLSDSLDKLNVMKAETKESLGLSLAILSKIGRESSKTYQMGSLNLLLENWKGLMECEPELIFTWKDQFDRIYQNLVLFKSFITNSRAIVNEESQNVINSIMDAVPVAEYILAAFMVGTCPDRQSVWNSELTEHVDRINAAIKKVNEKKVEVKEISISGKDLSLVPEQALLVPALNDMVVGFEVEMKLIRKRLAGHLKQLDVISIIGMPGLGKTTLARKVYEDSYTISYFDTRAWCCVSQEYKKKEVLLIILGSIIQLTNETRGKNESELSVMVHKELMGRRYFIVLDDIWDINAFMDLKCFFPDDNKGSRIMLTSRSKQIGLEAKFDSDLIEPALLTDEQSWDLLQRNVYNKGECPPDLCKIGQEIARRCRGLPLAVVVVGGVLAKGSRKQDVWEQVAGNLSSYRARDSQSQYMPALELSYTYLPNYLKPMFLYIGAFPEDTEIPADKLMQLWIAEGFVQQKESTSLEAETNLKDLIDRSLVMVAKRRSDGRVKSCHVHDLLRDMCLVKAKEENFMQHEQAYSEFPVPIIYKQLPDPIMYRRRLSILSKGTSETTSKNLVAYKDLIEFSITPPIYSLLYFNVGPYRWKEGHLPRVISCLKLLRVFDGEIFDLTEDNLDKDLTLLVHLRYMSIRADIEYIPLSISRLRSLEIFILKCYGSTSIKVPETIWEMTNLRHLDINQYATFSAVPENPFILDNLETLSNPCIDPGEEGNLFRKVPGLKKLRCTFKPSRGNVQLPNFTSLGKLESLRFYGEPYLRAFHSRGQLQLPLTLKELSLRKLNLRWSQISILHTLPNLEMLKLKYESVEGECWDMGDDDVFTNLKFLKLNNLGIKRWSASSENFPNLEKLVLQWCDKLEEIPSDFGEIETLSEIHVIKCGNAAEEIAKAIQKEQEAFGNESLNFYFDREK